MFCHWSYKDHIESGLIPNHFSFKNLVVEVYFSYKLLKADSNQSPKNKESKMIIIHWEMVYLIFLGVIYFACLKGIGYQLRPNIIKI